MGVFNFDQMQDCGGAGVSQCASGGDIHSSGRHFLCSIYVRSPLVAEIDTGGECNPADGGSVADMDGVKSYTCVRFGPAVGPSNQASLSSLSSGTVLATGNVKCWGYNGDGNLGYGDTANKGDGTGEMADNLAVVSLGTGRTASSIAMGFSDVTNDGAHMCVVLDNGQAKCWGKNTYGQLGYEHANGLGDGAGEMGDALLYVCLEAGCADSGADTYGSITATSGQSMSTDVTVSQIAVGASFTCALLSDTSGGAALNGKVFCFGNNDFGQLGIDSTTSKGSSAGHMGGNLASVTLGSVATQIAAGYAHACALLAGPAVRCWGANTHGQVIV